jgi:hypothetical protein
VAVPVVANCEVTMPVALEADSVPGMPEGTEVAGVAGPVTGVAAGGEAEVSVGTLAGGEAVSTRELLEPADEGGGAPLEPGTVAVTVESVEVKVDETMLTAEDEGGTASVELPGTPEVPGTPAVPETGVQVGSVLAANVLAGISQRLSRGLPLRLTITRF